MSSHSEGAAAGTLREPDDAGPGGYKSDDGADAKEEGRGLLSRLRSRRSLLAAVIMLFLVILSTILGVVLALPRSMSGDSKKKGGGGGCLPNGWKPGHEYNMTYADEHDRNWLLFIPPDYSTTEPNPVIFSYHGGGRTPERQRNLDRLETPEFNTKYIVVYPRGIEGRWQGTPNITSRDDVAYTNGILDELEATLLVDADRVYMTGKSNGGGFTGLAACHPQLSKRFAAFAPVSGSFYVEGARGCDPATVPIHCAPGRDRVPIMELHGGNDTTISYYGDRDRRGACLPAIRHWVELWAERNKVEDEAEGPTKTAMTGEAEVFTWGPKSGDFGLVTHVYEKDVAHSWPYTKQNADNRPLPKGNGDGPASYNATPVIIEFFRRHPLK